MTPIRIAIATVLSLAAGLGPASAVTPADVKKQGYIRAATANEVPYGLVQILCL